MPELYFRHGVMSASKTADLLMRAYNMNVKGKAVLVMKPSVDTRNSQIVSRVGISRHCDILITPRTNLLSLLHVLVEPSLVPTEGGEAVVEDTWVTAELRRKMSRHSKVRPSAIFVDEVQFLAVEQVEQLRRLSRYVDVFCYGLRTDYRCRFFPASLRLMELADAIEEISSSCQFCEEKAIVNAKFIDGVIQRDGSDVVDIGGEDKYMSMCWSCWDLSSAFANVEAFKTILTRNQPTGLNFYF